MSPQLGPRTEKRDSFTRLLGHLMKGTEKGCVMTVDVPTDGLEAIPQSYEKLVFDRAFYAADNSRDEHWLHPYNYLTPREAAFLLRGLDPGALYAAGVVEVERAEKLERIFVGHSKKHPADRSWRDWHAVAREIKADYDKRFDYFFEVEHPATGTVAVESTQTQTVQTQAATPSASTKAAGSVVNADGWTVRKPRRFTAYAVPLHRFLVSAHREGKPRPTARDVVEEWRVNRPAEIAQVMADSIDYYDSKGDTKAADLEAIRKAIGRMTSAR